MKPEKLRQAWERNGVWVKLRNPTLTDADLAELESLGVIPLPSGEVSVPPTVILDLQHQIKAVASQVAQLYRRRKREERLPQSEGG